MGIFDFLKNKRKDAKTPFVKENRSFEVEQIDSVQSTTKQRTLPSPMENKSDTILPESSDKEKMYLFFDTETNNASSGRLAIQLAWILTDYQGNVLEQENYYLNRDVPIDPFAQRVHGISERDLVEEGFDPVDVYVKFLSAVDKCDCLVAHNINYDMKTVENDLTELGLECSFDGKILLCTMEQTKHIVQAKDRNGHLKNPTLRELALFLFNDEDMLNDMHDANADTLILKASFFKLRQLIVAGEIKKMDRPITSKRTQSRSEKAIPTMTTSQAEMPELMTKDDLSNYNIAEIFVNKNVLITGVLSDIGIEEREYGISIVKQLGGISKNSIVKDIDFVVIGKSCGPKKIEDLVAKQQSGHKVKCMDGELFKLICTKSGIKI